MSDTIERVRAAFAQSYAVEREVGQGGMATVYLARDLKHDRTVALKVLRPELAAAMGTHDTCDLQSGTWPAGDWQPLTATPETAEFPLAWTPDGQALLIFWGTIRSTIVSVPVTGLMQGATTP